jgi:hypothetical protein
MVTIWYFGPPSVRPLFIIPVLKLSIVLWHMLLPRVLLAPATCSGASSTSSFWSHFSTVTMCQPSTCLNTRFNFDVPKTLILTFILFVRRCPSAKSVSFMYLHLCSLQMWWLRDYWISSFSAFGPLSAYENFPLWLRRDVAMYILLFV